MNPGTTVNDIIQVISNYPPIVKMMSECIVINPELLRYVLNNEEAKRFLDEEKNIIWNKLFNFHGYLQNEIIDENKIQILYDYYDMDNNINIRTAQNYIIKTNNYLKIYNN